LCINFVIPLSPFCLKSKWKEEKIRDYKKAIQFLESYRWSSYLDYIGKKNFPSITQRDFLSKFLGKDNELKKNTENWLKEIQLEEIKKIIIE